MASPPDPKPFRLFGVDVRHCVRFVNGVPMATLQHGSGVPHYTCNPFFRRLADLLDIRDEIVDFVSESVPLPRFIHPGWKIVAVSVIGIGVYHCWVRLRKAKDDYDPDHWAMVLYVPPAPAPSLATPHDPLEWALISHPSPPLPNPAGPTPTGSASTPTSTFTITPVHLQIIVAQLLQHTDFAPRLFDNVRFRQRQIETIISTDLVQRMVKHPAFLETMLHDLGLGVTSEQFDQITTTLMNRIKALESGGLVDSQSMQSQISGIGGKLLELGNAMESANTDLSRLRRDMDRRKHEANFNLELMQKTKRRLEEVQRMSESNDKATANGIFQLRERVTPLERRQEEIFTWKQETTEHFEAIEIFRTTLAEEITSHRRVKSTVRNQGVLLNTLNRTLNPLGGMPTLANSVATLRSDMTNISGRVSQIETNVQSLAVGLRQRFNALTVGPNSLTVQLRKTNKRLDNLVNGTQADQGIQNEIIKINRTLDEVINGPQSIYDQVALLSQVTSQVTDTLRQKAEESIATLNGMIDKRFSEFQLAIDTLKKEKKEAEEKAIEKATYTALLEDRIKKLEAANPRMREDMEKNFQEQLNDIENKMAKRFHDFQKEQEKRFRGILDAQAADLKKQADLSTQTPIRPTIAESPASATTDKQNQQISPSTAPITKPIDAVSSDALPIRNSTKPKDNPQNPANKLFDSVFSGKAPTARGPPVSSATDSSQMASRPCDKQETQVESEDEDVQPSGRKIARPRRILEPLNPLRPLNHQTASRSHATADNKPSSTEQAKSSDSAPQSNPLGSNAPSKGSKASAAVEASTGDGLPENPNIRHPSVRISDAPTSFQSTGVSETSEAASKVSGVSSNTQPSKGLQDASIGSTTVVPRDTKPSARSTPQCNAFGSDDETENEESSIRPPPSHRGRTNPRPSRDGPQISFDSTTFSQFMKPEERYAGFVRPPLKPRFLEQAIPQQLGFDKSLFSGDNVFGAFTAATPQSDVGNTTFRSATIQQGGTKQRADAAFDIEMGGVEDKDPDEEKVDEKKPESKKRRGPDDIPVAKYKKHDDDDSDDGKGMGPGGAGIAHSGAQANSQATAPTAPANSTDSYQNVDMDAGNSQRRVSNSQNVFAIFAAQNATATQQTPSPTQEMKYSSADASKNVPLAFKTIFTPLSVQPPGPDRLVDMSEPETYTAAESASVQNARDVEPEAMDVEATSSVGPALALPTVVPPTNLQTTLHNPISSQTSSSGFGSFKPSTYGSFGTFSQNSQTPNRKFNPFKFSSLPGSFDVSLQHSQASNTGPSTLQSSTGNPFATLGQRIQAAHNASKPITKAEDTSHSGLSHHPQSPPSSLPAKPAAKSRFEGADEDEVDFGLDDDEVGETGVSLNQTHVTNTGDAVPTEEDNRRKRSTISRSGEVISKATASVFTAREIKSKRPISLSPLAPLPAKSIAVWSERREALCIIYGVVLARAAQSAVDTDCAIFQDDALRRVALVLEKQTAKGYEDLFEEYSYVVSTETEKALGFGLDDAAWRKKMWSLHGQWLTSSQDADDDDDKAFSGGETPDDQYNPMPLVASTKGINKLVDPALRRLNLLQLFYHTRTLNEALGSANKLNLKDLIEKVVADEKEFINDLIQNGTSDSVFKSSYESKVRWRVEKLKHTAEKASDRNELKWWISETHHFHEDGG